MNIYIHAALLAMIPLVIGSIALLEYVVNRENGIVHFFTLIIKGLIA